MLKKPPIDIHEAAISSIIDDEGDDIGRTLTRAARVARDNAARLATLGEALAADATLPDAAKRARLREAALGLGSRVAAELDKARSVAEAELASIASATAAPPAPRDPGALAIEAELRAALRQMTHEDRRAALADDRVLGAAMRGPALLAGMSEAEAAATAEAYRKRAHPAAAARVDKIARARDALDRVGKSFMGYTAKAAALGEMDAQHQRVAEAAMAAVKGERAA